MKKRYAHISRFIAIVFLWIFSITLAPWSILHQHEEGPRIIEKHCTHQVHIKYHQEACLICTIHFDNAYITGSSFSVPFLQERAVSNLEVTPGPSYTALISQALRGPPYQA